MLRWSAALLSAAAAGCLRLARAIGSVGARAVCHRRAHARSAEWTAREERTRRQYQQVIDAYRRVYYGAPVSTKADPSVVAVAELMVEMGRRFDDDKILRSAIGQYQFLRTEYPGSKYRFDALFTIGEIYKDDLGDSAKARATFEEFLRRYPHNHLADDARRRSQELQAEPSRMKAQERAAEKAKAAGRQGGRRHNERRRRHRTIAAEDRRNERQDETAGAEGRQVRIACRA